MVAMARLTQRGEAITNLASFEALLEKPFTETTVGNLAELPHPTIQKFGVINIVIVGASRRFLAQITRHQNEVKFMSGSLQYSDYSDKAQFVVPYETLLADKAAWKEHGGQQTMPSDIYLNACENSLNAYEMLVRHIGRDAAGYAMPQGMRNVLVISATPYQWKHMISQRICRRNTSETRYVMLRCLEALQALEGSLFNTCGSVCMHTGCPEGSMCCGRPMYAAHTAKDIIYADFKLLVKGE
jgi:thymidylate synthase (FAD)